MYIYICGVWIFKEWEDVWICFFVSCKGQFLLIPVLWKYIEIWNIISFKLFLFFPTVSKQIILFTALQITKKSLCKPTVDDA